MVLSEGVCSLHFGGDREPWVGVGGWFNLKTQRQMLVSKSRTSPDITCEPAICRSPFCRSGGAGARESASLQLPGTADERLWEGDSVGGAPLQPVWTEKSRRRQGRWGSCSRSSRDDPFSLPCLPWSPPCREKYKGAVYLSSRLRLQAVHSLMYSFLRSKETLGRKCIVMEFRIQSGWTPWGRHRARSASCRKPVLTA